MASARLDSATCFLRQKSVSRNLIRVIGVLLVIALVIFGSSKTKTGVVNSTGIHVSSDVASPNLMGPTSVSAEPHTLDYSNSALKPEDPQRASLQSPAGKPKPKGEITIIPKIEVFVAASALWADGQTPALIYISLKATNGKETWNHPAEEEMLFQLEPRTTQFDPAVVKIAPGKNTSEPATLTSKHPIKLQVTCTPERRYEGLAVATAQPQDIEFVTPIDAIGIEPVSGTCPLNVSMPIEIFLYNKKDPKTRLPPRSPISVQVVSESGNGNITNQPVQLTQQELSRFIGYVGTKAGRDMIKAIASYEGLPIEGRTDRRIVFPLFVFLSGVAGSMLGAGLRHFKAAPSKRRMIFLESLFYGVVICIILIMYPPGTKLPEISNFLQPLLIFVLGALVSAFGPPSVHWALSFIPKTGGQTSASS